MPPRPARHMRSVVIGVAVYAAAGFVIGATACERTRPVGQSATSGGTPSAEAAPSGQTVAAPPVSRWNDTLAGSDLFVAGGNSAEAVIVLPGYTDSTIGDAPTTDSLIGRHPHVDLFARRGLIVSAILVEGTPGNFSGSCTAWPTAHVATPQGAPPDWSVAFEAGHATTLPMDSIGAVSMADSARRAAAIARVASTLPNDTALAFRGVPFSVRDVHAFTLPSGDTVMAAEVVRRLNQEANPQEEHLLIVLERDTLAGPAGAPPPFVAAYSERTSGAEDDVESTEVLAAVMLGHGARQMPAIIIGRDYGDGSSYSLVGRIGPRRWRARWSSAYVGC